MIFDKLAREINSILGSDYAIYSEFAPEPQKFGEVAQKYTNWGTLYVNYGSLLMLPNNRGLTGTLVLSLMLRIPQGTNVSSVITAPLQNLIAQNNGIIVVGNDTDGTPYSYVINYKYPISDGEVKFQLGYTDFVQYDISADFVVSRELVLGQQIKPQINYNGSWQDLSGLVSFTPSNSPEIDTSLYLNSGADKSEVYARKWSAQLVYYYNPEDELNVALWKSAENTDGTQWQIQYSVDGGNTYEQRTVYLINCTLPCEMGAFVVATIGMTEAVDNG